MKKYLYLKLFYLNQILWNIKIRNQQMQKISGPDVLNQDYIRYSDIKM